MPVARGEGCADIHYEVRGSGASAIVMSAGMGGSGRFWEPQVAALSERHRVILYDHVGTGRSTRQIQGDLSVGRMARDAVAVMDAEGLSAAHFVGHAIGGIVSLECALQFPSRTRSLTIVNGWARADAHLRRCFAVRKEILRMSGPEGYVRAQPLFLFPPRWIAEHDAHLDAEAAEMVDHFPVTSVMLNRIDLFLGFDATDRLASIRTPTLIMSSADDMLVPPYLSEQLAQGIDGAEHQVVDYGAHAFTAVCPDRFNQALLAFLSKQDSSA